MGIKTVLKRIERAEQVLKTQSIFSQDCICFPEKEQPSFHWRIELEIAAMVKCPLHGDRFKPLAMFYVAEWLRKKREWFIATRRSAQYQKAWRASFPPGLWPAEEQRVGNKIFLRLKDQSVLLAVEYNWKTW
jgi:hypothetical protein